MAFCVDHRRLSAICSLLDYDILYVLLVVCAKKSESNVHFVCKLFGSFMFYICRDRFYFPDMNPDRKLLFDSSHVNVRKHRWKAGGIAVG